MLQHQHLAGDFIAFVYIILSSENINVFTGNDETPATAVAHRVAATTAASVLRLQAGKVVWDLPGGERKWHWRPVGYRHDSVENDCPNVFNLEEVFKTLNKRA